MNTSEPDLRGVTAAAVTPNDVFRLAQELFASHQIDLRTVPALLSEGIGVSPVNLAALVPDLAADAPVYYLGIAGYPAIPTAPPPVPAQPVPPPVLPSSAEPTAPAAAPAVAPGLFDPTAIRRDFPILAETVHGRPLIWLDNAATTQKPRAVIDRLTYFYEHENSNIHRAAHALAARATDAYEGARDKVRRFLNAPSAQEIVFVRGATEAINLVAQSWGRRNVGAGDEIVITWLEHHANIVPWQRLAAETGARLRVAPVNDKGEVDLEQYERLLGPRTRLVSFTQVSNALGTIVPAKQMVEIARRRGVPALIDGAQA
ncbi:MAG: cysteine desulfurase / selenocysteine lyase, partial [Myxococcales bacterium]|nr:cysteine desulfurase / selenocysteine lyase [Myxococcales bacterium]